MADNAKIVEVPLLPLRDIVVFPDMVVPLFVGRDKSVEAIERSLKSGKQIMLAAQKDPQVTDPLPDDIYDVGTLSTIHQVVRLPDGMIKLLVEGQVRGRIESYIEMESVFVVSAMVMDFQRATMLDLERGRQSVLEAFERFVQLNKKVGKEVQSAVTSAVDPGRVADLIAANLDLDIEDRQFLLEISDDELRLNEILRLLRGQIEVLEIEKKIQGRVKEQMERNQKEYYLNEQMKAIQGELGGGDDGRAELEELREKLDAKPLPEHARERAEQELKKLRLMTPSSAEAAVIRNYLEWILAIPWQEERPLDIDLDKVRMVLDEDHYGLDRVKERIVEFLAVRKLTDSIRGPKLCLVGPPGVGKTSLAKSIARSLDLEFVRQSLGGVRDEAEIRGHRRTYIGALPGRIVQGLRKVDSSNPVFLLDEIDKLASDFRGDPGSALLEVLDPEQNDTFMDHYLDLELDLSRIFFITTANGLHSIPGPLRDRMEVIELASYTEEEKIEIAVRHLIPKQLDRHGLGDYKVSFQKPAVRKMVRNYTREAGVRNLERTIEAVARKVAVDVVEERVNKDSRTTITTKTVRDYLGPEKFRDPDERRDDLVGVTQGLAWTEVGGQVLLTEVTVVPGRGKLDVTGKLGDVMQESVRAAMSYVRSRADRLGIDPGFYRNVDLHVHVPEGAVPKDGPSAGITMAIGLTSALTGIPVRSDTAMTGEITLRGRVLPVGGLKEKILAAHRSGIQRVLIPSETEKDLEEIPDDIRSQLEIILVEEMDDVLQHALSFDDPDGIFAYLEKRGMRHPLPDMVIPDSDQPSVN